MIRLDPLLHKDHIAVIFGEVIVFIREDRTSMSVKILAEELSSKEKDKKEERVSDERIRVVSSALPPFPFFSALPKLSKTLDLLCQFDRMFQEGHQRSVLIRRIEIRHIRRLLMSDHFGVIGKENSHRLIVKEVRESNRR